MVPVALIITESPLFVHPHALYFYCKVFILLLSLLLKWTLVQALRLCTGRTARRGSRGIALLFLDHGTRRGEGSASRPGRSLPPGKTWYPLYSRLGGSQGRSGRVRKISPPTGIRSPDRPALSQSLYRLRYSANYYYYYYYKIYFSELPICGFVFSYTVRMCLIWPDFRLSPPGVLYLLSSGMLCGVD